MFVRRLERSLAVLVLFASVPLACAKGNAVTSDAPHADASVADAGAAPDSAFDDDAQATSSLEIHPANAVIAATGTPVTQVLEAVDARTQTPVAAVWKVDESPVGDIDGSTGIFTANGVIGGVVNVTATLGALTATTTLTVNVALSDANPSISAADQAKLRAGGALSNDPTFRWLYPYDATVFPRGLRAPLLQLAGASASAAYVRVTSAHLTYDAFVPVADPLQIALDQARWRAITDSAGGTDTVSVSVTKLTAGVATGPVRVTWTIAQGSLRGSVYYNTYKSAQAGGDGALMRVRPGSTDAASVLAPTCTVCHSVSANGNVIVAGSGFSDGNPTTSGVTTIAASGAPVAGYTESLGRFAFGGLTPDGRYMMSNAIAPGGIRGLSGSTGSSLFDTQNGQKKAAPGWDGVVANAQMPSFSPDGKAIVYNDRDSSPGHALATMRFDASTLAFSARTPLYEDAGNLLAWPAFLPDGAAVVFHAGSDFGTEGSTADIELVEVATKAHRKLPALNGFLGSDQAFTTAVLPYGEGAEGHLNYEPTVLPVAVGGYYWIVFTSRRCYGNALTPSTDKDVELSPRKKLWVAALDMTSAPGVDRSHPAFYLPGQDLATGNMRGFWALDPCRANGADCESGDECCGGYCRAPSSDAGLARSCASTPSGCSVDLEKCTTSSDCCGGHACVNGHCAAPPPR